MPKTLAHLSKNQSTRRSRVKSCFHISLTAACSTARNVRPQRKSRECVGAWLGDFALMEKSLTESGRSLESRAFVGTIAARVYLG